MLEAIRQQRNAAAVIGHDIEDFLDYQRITAARGGDAPGDAVLLRGDPPELPRLLADQAGNLLHRHRHLDPAVDVHPGGSIDLIVVSLPALLLLGRRQDHSRTWHARFSAFDVLAACHVVLRPGGYLVAVTGGGELESAAHDLGSTTVSLCSELGLRYWQHIVCLLVPIEGGELKPRRRRRRRRAQPGLPRVVHQNVHVFRKPDPTSAHERWPL